LHEEFVPISDIARRLGRSARTIKTLIQAAEGFPTSYIPCHKPIVGGPRKTSKQTDDILRRAVMKEPAISSTELKKMYPELLKNVSLRTIRHRLQIDLELPSRRAAKKPLLTKKMKDKRIAFAKKYVGWSKERWSKVMFSD
jgi:hypothetical protein